MSEGSGPRPRPQFGEYASPEEQRARIQQPEATWALETGQTVDDASAAPAVRRAEGARPSASARPRRGDRIATFALLGYGLFIALSSIPALSDYGTYADTLLGIMGADVDYVAPPGAQGWGIAAALVLGLGWIATAALSWASLRRGRLTWWIPLAAGLLLNLVASALMLVPLMGDASLWSALMAGVGG